MATFTKNKQTGEYDVIGLQNELEAGCFCQVKKKDGSTTTVTIKSVSKPFKAKFGPLKDKMCVIGKIQQEKTTSRRSSSRSNRCCGCGGSLKNAPHHRAMEGYCGYCAFDEFDC